jgi:hypothetical protein
MKKNPPSPRLRRTRPASRARKPRANKQRATRAASFKRIAKDLRAYGRAHASVARDKSVNPDLRNIHQAVSIAAFDSALANEKEANRLREMP